MGIFNKKEKKNYYVSEEQKKKVEDICTEFLKEFSKKYDERLSEGSFGSEENYYIWDDFGFLINFLGISQYDYFDNIKAFEEIGKELTEKIRKVIDIEDAKYADDCPIIFYKVLNK